VRVDDALVTLIVYDTAGQERFAGMTSMYFRLGEVCLLCVDLSTKNCLAEYRVDWWRTQVKSQNSSCSCVLVGTKGDMAIEDEIRHCVCYSSAAKIPFFRTSAKTGLLGSLFYHVAECCMRRRAERKIKEERLLLTQRQPRTQTCC